MVKNRCLPKLQKSAVFHDANGIGWSIGLGRFGAVVGPAVAGYLIAAGFSMSANYFIFAIPMAIGGYIAYRLHID